MGILSFSNFQKYILFFYRYFFDKNLVLLAIFVLAFGLRIMGTNPGYYTTHPDEPTITESVKRISLHLNFEPQAYYYGSLLSTLYSVPTILLFVPYIFTLFTINNPQNLANFNDTFNAFIITGKFFEYWVRSETAILSSFTTLIAYHLGKKLFNHYTAVVAAFYIAVNYRHVLSSNLALADAPAAFFVLLSVYLSSRLLEKLSWKTYIWSGLGLGLIFSVKYFVYTIPTFLLCHLLGSWKNTYRMKLKNRILTTFASPKLILCCLISFSLFSLINIFIFLKPDDALFQIQYNTTKYGLSFSLEKFLNFTNISYYPSYYLYKFAFGEILTLFLTLGLIYSLLKYFKSSLILLATIIPFLYMFLIISNTTETRFYSAIIPLILFFPAILTVDLAKKLKNITDKINFMIALPLLISLLSFTIGYQSLNLSLISSYYFSTPHNSDSVQEWILKEIPDNSNYVYFWGTPTPPGYKKINSKFISVDENDYPSMEDLNENSTDYIAIGSDPGNVINGLLWINNNQVIKQAIFNDSFLWKYLGDSYASLITQELASYRIKEFTKPWPNLDPSFFVVKYPEFWNVQKGNNNIIIRYDFQKNEDLNQWAVNSYNSTSYYSISLISNAGSNHSKAMLLVPGNKQDCAIPIVKIKSQLLKVEPLKFYTLSGWGKRENIVNKEKNNGFLRLDFYSKSNELLKSYVSKQLKSSSELQNINAAGIAPSNSDSAQIVIQLNNCLNEKYIIDEVEVTSLKNGATIDLSEYPYFNVKIDNTFIWLPHL